jgi:hypothetical protein
MRETATFSRRYFGKVVLAGLAWSPALAAKIRSLAGGVHIGLQTYSLRTVPHDGAIDTIINAMKDVGLGECELFSPQVEPAQPSFVNGGRGPGGGRAPLTPEQQATQKAAADALTKWRLTVPMNYFTDIRRKFAAAGIDIHSYSARFGDSDEEIDRSFVMTKALGAKVLSARVPLPITKRVASFAEKHKMIVGIQSTDADALAQQLPISKYFRIDLDIGDFTRAGHDSLQYVKDNYMHMSDIHLKDCKLNGPSVPFGEGDSHMKEVLQFLKEKNSSIRAYVDCDYPGTGQSVEEIKKCYSYVRAALA